MSEKRLNGQLLDKGDNSRWRRRCSFESRIWGLTCGFVFRLRTSPCYHSLIGQRIPLKVNQLVAHVFKKGETVVHPDYGAAIIEDRCIREFQGEKREYLMIRVVYAELTVNVPVTSARELGLRQVVSRQQAKKVLGVLEEDESSMSVNWSRRFKENIEKVRSGDLFQVAEVVRNLSIRERGKGLSAGEKRAVFKARQILTSELMFANDITEEQAEIQIDKILDDAHEARVPTGA